MAGKPPPSDHGTSSFWNKRQLRSNPDFRNCELRGRQIVIEGHTFESDDLFDHLEDDLSSQDRAGGRAGEPSYFNSDPTPPRFLTDTHRTVLDQVHDPHILSPIAPAPGPAVNFADMDVEQQQ